MRIAWSWGITKGISIAVVIGTYHLIKDFRDKTTLNVEVSIDERSLIIESSNNSLLAYTMGLLLLSSAVVNLFVYCRFMDLSSKRTRTLHLLHFVSLL